MAIPTKVNNPMPDADSNPHGNPAEVMGNIYQTLAHSIGLEMQDAVHEQQENMDQSANIEGVDLIYETPNAASSTQSPVHDGSHLPTQG